MCSLKQGSQAFLHQGLVLWKTMFPWTSGGVGGGGGGVVKFPDDCIIVHFISVIILSALPQIIRH